MDFLEVKMQEAVCLEVLQKHHLLSRRQSVQWTSWLHLKETHQQIRNHNSSQELQLQAALQIYLEVLSLLNSRQHREELLEIYSVEILLPQLVVSLEMLKLNQPRVAYLEEPLLKLHNSQLNLQDQISLEVKLHNPLLVEDYLEHSNQPNKLVDYLVEQMLFKSQQVGVSLASKLNLQLVGLFLVQIHKLNQQLVAFLVVLKINQLEAFNLESKANRLHNQHSSEDSNNKLNNQVVYLVNLNNSNNNSSLRHLFNRLQTSTFQ